MIEQEGGLLFLSARSLSSLNLEVDCDSRDSTIITLLAVRTLNIGKFHYRLCRFISSYREIHTSTYDDSHTKVWTQVSVVYSDFMNFQSYREIPAATGSWSDHHDMIINEIKRGASSPSASASTHWETVSAVSVQYIIIVMMSSYSSGVDCGPMMTTTRRWLLMYNFCSTKKFTIHSSILTLKET